MDDKTTEYIKRIKEQFLNRDYDYTYIKEIKNQKEKVPIFCNTHQNMFYSRVYHLLNGKCGCNECKKDVLSNLKSFGQSNFENKINCDFENIIVCSKYSSNNKKIKFLCKKCGTVFYRRPRNMYTSCGCPTCTKYISKLELEIINLLKKNDIKYIYQHSFSWLGRKTIDFFLPDYNIAIECQGKQHFVEKDFFGGTDGLEKIKKRDIEKYNLCLENGISILYYADYDFNFPYEVFINKEELLSSILNCKKIC
jgi:very-short-patch-repair endonuclease